MKKKNILWLAFLWAMCTPIFAQENFRKIGIGIGYYSSSIVGDSVHPFELYNPQNEMFVSCETKRLKK